MGVCGWLWVGGWVGVAVGMCGWVGVGGCMWVDRRSTVGMCGWV